MTFLSPQAHQKDKDPNAQPKNTQREIDLSHISERTDERDRSEEVGREEEDGLFDVVGEDGWSLDGDSAT